MPTYYAQPDGTLREYTNGAQVKPLDAAVDAQFDCVARAQHAFQAAIGFPDHGEKARNASAVLATAVDKLATLRGLQQPRRGPYQTY